MSNNCTQQLASDLDTFAAAHEGKAVHMSETHELLEEAMRRLNIHYGTGNRHSVAVLAMFNSALDHSQNGRLRTDFLGCVARRLRNIAAAPSQR